MRVLQDLMETVTSTVVVQNVGWLLIHSLWQCMFIALVAICMAKAMRSSSTRYWMYSMALSLMVIAPVVTMFSFPQKNDVSAVDDHSLTLASAELKEGFLPIEGDDEKSMPLVANEERESDAAFENTDATPASVLVKKSIATSWSDSIKAILNPWLPTIVAVWCCGVMLFSIRPVWGWLMVRRLLRVGTSPVAMHVQEALQRVCEKMQVRRRVEMQVSTLVGSPIVVGCFRSVILVPASFVSSLPMAHVEAILAHELAHVRRYDYLVNLLQTLVETLFFYHPAAWWLSHRIRIERENCCDDLVVSVFNNKAEYGRALLALEEFRGSVARSALALSARDGSLLHRIRRLFAAPSVGGQRMSAGITAVATAVTSITTVLVFWSAMSAAQNKVDDVPFGEASHGLRARIVALRPEVNDSAPNLELRQSDYVNSDELTFGIELTNTSDEPVTLAGIRYGDGFAKEVQGKLRTELLGPYWFEFEFMDSEGKPIRRTHREFHEPWQVAESSSTHVLAPNQSMTEVLRPGKFRTPMDFDLPAGKYKVRLHYHGPNEVFREKVGKLWPNKAILNAWPYEVVSNTIDFQVAEGLKLSNGKGDTNTPDGSRLAAKLVWGNVVDGLQAALEYRTAQDASGDPAIAPGIPIGTPFNVIFHVKNVSDKTITFISETGRQGDKVHVANERGEKVEVKDVHYSGWPIDVAWTLEPGEMAQLSLLTPSLHSLDQPGRYNVHYTIRFNSRIQKDDAGNVIFPRPGDYDKEVDTGVTPLFLTAVQNSAAVKPTKHGATRAGRWQITDDAELEITQKTFHAADIVTSGVIRLKGDKDHPRHVPLSIAMDHFANRERWKAAWEEGQPVLWYAKGQGDGPGRQLPWGTKVKIEELRRIDFSNPDCIVHHAFGGWVADQLPAVEIRAALEEEFEIKLDGQEHHRYYESARLGLQPDDSSRQMFVWVGENGKCEVQNLAWAPLTDESEHLKCDLKTLPETLALVLKKFRTKAGQNVPIYAFVTSRPDLPTADLKTVLDVCRKNGLKTPDMPEAIQVAATTEPASDSPHGEIRGLLTDIEGKPVAGAVVACGAIYREDGQDGGTRTTTDAEGHYRLVAPSPGIYIVFLKAYDADPTLMAVADDGLKVEAGKVSESTLRLVAGRKVVGKAVDENGVPLAGLTVMCYSAARPHSLGTVQSTTAKDDGAFEFYLAPGPGQIYATEMVTKTEENPFRTGRTGSIHLTVPKTGAMDPVTLKLGHSKSRFGSDEWLTRSTPGTTIISHEHQDDVTGVVVDEAGKPLANAMVIKLDDKPVTTDAEGRFRVPVPKGTQFVMHAFHPGYRVWFGTPTAGDKLKIVMLKKRSPDVAPAANGNRAPAAQPKNPQSRLNEWKNAWREFYVAQSESDLTFARNEFMDLTGKAATDEDVRVFARMSAVDKRSQVIDKLLDGGAFEKFQAQLTSENDAFQSQQQALPSRILRGPQAKYRADVYRTKAGKPVNGLTLAIALRSATNRFRIGERIPLDVLVLNTSKEAITHDFSFDFIANPPRLLDESGNEVPIEKLFLTGTVPLYRETLRSGDTFIYPHIGLGLGENPQPGENWHPHTPVLKPGKYRLTQRWNDLTSGEVEFEVVSDEADNARAKVEAIPTWLRLSPGTQIVEHTDAKFVSGVVVDEEGRPIAGCSVEHPGIVGPETDDQGKFQYKQSTPHRTVLRAYHPDYRPWHGAPELGDVVRIVLQRKPKAEAVNGTREMTVRVIDSQTAEPVPNVKVTVSRYEGPQNGTVAATAVTNQDGTAVMRGLDFIQHRLSLSADQPVSYVGQLAHPGAAEEDVVMLVDRACELALRAVDSETGKGIAGVRFDRERALAELWAEPVVDDILGSNRNGEILTNEDGYAHFLVGPATWSYMILKYPKGYDSIVPVDGRQEVEIKTPMGGKVEYTFRLVESRSQTNANGAAGARTKQQIVAAWTQRARDVEHSRLSWTENRIYPRGELISPNQAQPPADDFTVQWKKSLVISGDKCRVEGVGKTWLDRIGDFAPFEFTAVRNGTGSSLHHFPGQPESLGYSTPSLAGLCDVTYRPAMLGMNPADPEFGRIKLDDYHVEPDQVDIDGRMCLKLVRKDGRNVDTHVFLDPNRQFVVTRTVGLEGGQISRSFDLSYRQDERGVWYPATWRLEIMNGTDSVRGFHITVVSTRFESQYDADPRSFAIEYPDGMQFHNLGKLDRRVAEKATAWKTRRPDSTESSSNEKGEILDDDSVSLSLPSPNISTPVAKFKFSDATEINMLRLELLPDTRFEDRRLARMPGRTLKLFEVKPSITFADGTSRTFDWDKCLNLRTPDDEEVSNLIDHASDTGWTVPPLAKDQAAHELIFQLKTPLKLKAGDTLAIELDSGGSNELDTIARFRVSFPPQDKPESKEKK